MLGRQDIAARPGQHIWTAGPRALCALLLIGAAVASCTQPRAPDVGWLSYGADESNTKYSPVSQIDTDNVGELGIVWRRPGVAPELTDEHPDLSPLGAFLSTPLMVDGVLYASNAVGLVEAFDPATGETLWIQEPLEEGFQGVAGRSTRGVAFWGSDASGRILAVRGDQLISLDPETGMLDPSFGDRGRVNLSYDTPYPGNFGWRAPPMVVGDVVVIGGCQDCGDDFGSRAEQVSEDVRGFDVRTGEHLWTFHVVPQPGEFGHDTWGGGTSAGAAGAWVPLAADPELGHVYLPLGSPYAANYGGHRPGENLFANSLVALDVETGERVWHYQLVHHDLWDYDPASAPILGDITVDGRPVRAVMQLTKAGFVFTFDRMTGEPVWPIEERPVPPSTVPGEQASPTQPFPTRPPPFDRQGVSVDDLIDFTPELRAEALEIAEEYLLGPLYTPPVVEADGVRGTLTLPGATGAANWNGGAFDPETGMLYVMSHTHTWQNGLVRPPPDTEAAIEWMHGPAGEFCCEAFEVYGPDGLPLVKPPYARITAFNMNSGEMVWEAPNGDGPRDHPRLRDLDLPPLGSAGRGAPLLTESLLFAGEGDEVIVATPRGGGGNMFRAFDKVTGGVLWETELPAGGTTGAPITYIHGGRQYILVATSGRDDPHEWIAFALP